MANKLEFGVTRIGNFYDGNDATPQTRATLELDEHGPLLTIPWDEGETEVYSRWFMTSVIWADDPDQTRHRYEVPDVLLFRDDQGQVLLLGCRSAGYQMNALGPGRGRVRARVAVLGADLRYDFRQVNGLRTDIEGLRDWFHISNRSFEMEHSENGGVRALSYRLQAPDDIPLPDTGNLTVQPHWRVTDGEDSTTLHDLAYLASGSEEPEPIEDHLERHRGVRDLLAISRWHPATIEPVGALRADDSEANERSNGQRWRDVVGAPVDREPAGANRGYLITYNDLGPEGISRWLNLRASFRRAIGPLVAGLDQRRATGEVHMSQIGIALEALGYLLVQRDDGKTEAQANAMRVHPRLERIARDIKEALPFDTDEWAREATNVYNAIKHANRAVPDLIDVLNRWRESTLAFRVWIAFDLGVPLDVLKQRVQVDPMNQPYRLR